jgi:hypothetical protein
MFVRSPQPGIIRSRFHDGPDGRREIGTTPAGGGVRSAAAAAASLPAGRGCDGAQCQTHPSPGDAGGHGGRDRSSLLVQRACGPRSRRSHSWPSARPSDRRLMIPSVAKRKPASTLSGKQSDRQPSTGASRPTGPQVASSTDAASARTRAAASRGRMLETSREQVSLRCRLWGLGVSQWSASLDRCLTLQREVDGRQDAPDAVQVRGR